MKKKYTLLAIIGISLEVLLGILYFGINIFEFYGGGKELLVALNIIQLIAPLLMLPFFINLYKNQK